MYNAKHLRFAAKKRYLGLAVAFLLSSAATFAFLRYSQPVPQPTVQQLLSVAENSQLPPEISWPVNAEASIGTFEDGILLSKPGTQEPQPTASTAKLITALTILKAKPLELGEQGPILTIDQSDITIYNNYAAANGSLVAVQIGQKLSQYQMLQGILVRSGNNLADSLAIWAFGSLSEYQVAAQKLVDELGMADTVVGTDASGLSPTTTSTANDLTKLGIAAMKHEVIREIVRQETSNLPTDGVKPSTNWMLGQNGVVGVKTGYTLQIGGVFIIASEHTPEGEKPTTIIAAVQGEPSTYEAIVQANQLAEATKRLFVKKTIVKKGDVVATITTPWGETSDVIAEKDIITFGWKYAPTTPEFKLQSNAPFQQGDVIGKISVGDQSSNLIAASSVNKASWKWRLTTSR